MRYFTALLFVCLFLALGMDEASAEPMLASWYGDESGSVTASGETFDPSGFTAAHRTLPFGTELTVCLEGCVEVTVNDRGPYVGGRDLDLSQGAAEAIGLTEAGVAVVEVTVGAHEPVAEPPVSVLPDTGGPQWTALVLGVLFVIVGLLLRRKIR